MIPTIWCGPQAIAEFTRPSSDVDATGWTVTGGSGGISGAIDETSADDADYASSTVTIEICPTKESQDCEVALSNPVGVPGPSATQQLTVRHRAGKILVTATGTVDLTVEVRQGATLIATRSYTNIGSGGTTRTFTLTDGEYGTITDHNDLRLYFKVDACIDAEPGTCRGRLYWAEAEYSRK